MNQVVHLTLLPVDSLDLSQLTRVLQEYPNVPKRLLDLILSLARLHPLLWSALSSSLLDELAQSQTSAKSPSSQYQLNSPIQPFYFLVLMLISRTKRSKTNPSCNHNRYTDILSPPFLTCHVKTLLYSQMLLFFQM